MIYFDNTFILNVEIKKLKYLTIKKIVNLQIIIVILSYYYLTIVGKRIIGANLIASLGIWCAKMLISRNIIGYLAAIENVLEAELLNLLLYLVYVEILYFGTFFQCFIFLDVLHFFYIILFRFFLWDIRFNINVFFCTKFTLEFLLSIKNEKLI